MAAYPVFVYVVSRAGRQVPFSLLCNLFSKAEVTLERFYIFRETKINNEISDRLTIKPNIFETVVQKDPHRGLPAAYKHLNNST